jgi:hypothetical protein
MSDKYWFSSGGFIDIQGISITPNVSAKVQALCFYSGGTISMKFVNIEGDEYLAWGNDDDYMIALVGHKLGMGTRVKPIDTSIDPERTEVEPYEYQLPNVPTYVPRMTTADARSVHNEADIQRIQTLQQQLDEQATKLKTITELLFKNGSI